MIKFKKIIQKAAGGALKAAQAGSFFSPIARAATPQSKPPRQEDIAAGIAEAEAMLEAPAPKAPPPREAGEPAKSHNVDDALVESVLGDIFGQEKDTPSEGSEGSAQADSSQTETTPDQAPPQEAAATQKQALPEETSADDESTADEISALLENIGKIAADVELEDPDGDEAVAEGQAAPRETALDEAVKAEETRDSSEEESADDESMADEISALLESMGDMAVDAEQEDSQEDQSPAEPTSSQEEAPGEAPEQQPGQEPENTQGPQTPSGASEDEPSAQADSQSETSPGTPDDMFADVDSLLAELGDLGLSVDDEELEVPAEATAEAPGALGEVVGEVEKQLENLGADDRQELPTLTDDERQALLEDPPSAEEAGSVPMAEELSMDVEKAVEKGAEIEMDFSPEAVGLESPDEPQGELTDDTDDLLSSLLGEMENLSPPDEKSGSPETEEEGFSELMGGSVDTDDTPDEAAGADVATDVDQAAGAGRAGDDPPGEAGETNQSQVTSEVSEDDLVAQALEVALGETFENDQGESNHTQSADAGRKGTGDSGADAVDEPVESDADATQADEAARRPPQEDASAPQSNSDTEEMIQEEMVSRAKDVEQALLDELFGTDTEEFSREVKSELAQVGHGEDDPVPGEANASQPGAKKPAGDNGQGDDSAKEKTPVQPGLLHRGAMWLALEMNRPFEKWMTPAVRRGLSLLSLGLISTGIIYLVAALALLFRG